MAVVLSWCEYVRAEPSCHAMHGSILDRTYASLGGGGSERAKGGQGVLVQKRLPERRIGGDSTRPDRWYCCSDVSVYYPVSPVASARLQLRRCSFHDRPGSTILDQLKLPFRHIFADAYSSNLRRYVSLGDQWYAHMIDCVL